MSYAYVLSYDTINHIDMYCNTFSLRFYDEERMSLPKMALCVMIMNHENILLDLEDLKKPVKKYWSDREVAIYTKEVFDIKSRKPLETTRKKVLCISKPPVDLTLTAEMFQLVVLRATILNRIGRDDCDLSRVDHPLYNLNSTKSIIFHPDERLSIFEEDTNQFEMKLKILISLIMQRKTILADLHSQDSTGENVYEGTDFLTLKTIPFENSRAFCFWLDGIEENITLKKHTFDLMLHVALGAPMWREGMKEDAKIKEAKMMYWESTPFAVVTKIQFSPDSKIFTIFNDTYNMMLTLSTSAIKALLDRKQQVLSDLECKAVAPTGEKDFINEYWTDETFAIRTGVLYNLYREIDCNVVKFTRIENDECVFVAHKGGFLKLLESYQNRRRNAKRR